MTQEQKELLIKDLCARLPYEVILNVDNGKYREDKKIWPSLFDSGNLWDAKPYLRPMESMTEEELKEYMDLIIPVDGGNAVIEEEKFIKVEDFYNQHLLDYRGLIPKGLALEALEGMYNIK